MIWLFVCGVFASLTNLMLSFVASTDRGPLWRTWTFLFVVVAGLYGAMTWSYWGMISSGRSAEEHLALVTLLGPALLLWPGIFGLMLLFVVRKQVRDESQRIHMERRIIESEIRRIESEIEELDS